MKLNRFKQLLESTMGDVKPLVNEYDEDISYDIKSVECDGSEYKDGYVDIDDNTIVIRYCKGDTESLEYLKRKGKKLLYLDHGL